ncbi:DUF5685 family protein [Peptostreptococcus faecalis]|uniref:DUF5685 family protein n=1 Tax=Peptostreptococcus faecalis TaxID=2045015 RepID=UPI000C7992F5|nr:DUF5685 family protein [Peptostreptococcus faecalis]
MFGYVRINKMDLTFREYEHYKAYYCGLCKYLKRNHTEISRLSINYDITFLILLLTSVYKPKAEVFHERCVVNPVKKKKHMINEITEYAASMNILLTYYKIEDNVNDDGGITNNAAKLAYKSSFKSAYKKYPEKAEYIKEKLGELSELESKNSTNIDEVSNIFGDIMKEIFTYKEDEYTDRLGSVGFNLGKYIYILDAYEDLDADIKSGSYNPFKEYEEDREALKLKVEKLIDMILSRVEESIINLDISVNNAIIDNIIYSGIYLRYKGILAGIQNKKNQT